MPNKVFCRVTREQLLKTQAARTFESFSWLEIVRASGRRSWYHEPLIIAGKYTRLDDAIMQPVELVNGIRRVASSSSLTS
jgi:hypothetical protein